MAQRHANDRLLASSFLAKSHNLDEVTKATQKLNQYDLSPGKPLGNGFYSDRGQGRGGDQNTHNDTALYSHVHLFIQPHLNSGSLQKIKEGRTCFRESTSLPFLVTDSHSNCINSLAFLVSLSSQ